MARVILYVMSASRGTGESTEYCEDAQAGTLLSRWRKATSET